MTTTWQKLNTKLEELMQWLNDIGNVVLDEYLKMQEKEAEDAKEISPSEREGTDPAKRVPWLDYTEAQICMQHGQDDLEILREGSSTSNGSTDALNEVAKSESFSHSNSGITLSSYLSVPISEAHGSAAAQQDFADASEVLDSEEQTSGLQDYWYVEACVKNTFWVFREARKDSAARRSGSCPPPARLCSDQTSQDDVVRFCSDKKSQHEVAATGRCDDSEVSEAESSPSPWLTPSSKCPDLTSERKSTPVKNFHASNRQLGDGRKMHWADSDTSEDENDPWDDFGPWTPVMDLSEVGPRKTNWNKVLEDPVDLWMQNKEAREEKEAC